MRRLVAAAACVVAALPMSPAAAEQVESPPYVAVVGSLYYPGDVKLVRGSTLSLVNLDSIGHDIVSTDREPDGSLPFWSDIVYGPVAGPGALTAEPMTVVRGVESLGLGYHPFTCSLHTEMRGTIEIVALPEGSAS